MSKAYFKTLVGAAILLTSLPFVRSHHSSQGHYRDQAQVSLGEFSQPSSARSQTWLEKYGKQIDQTFSGPLSFSHLPYSRCLEDESAQFDIALLGMPFDTAVSYRPGARFGPYAIRSGSRRQRNGRGYTLSWKVDPYELGPRIMDCGDVSQVSTLTNKHETADCNLVHSKVPVSPFDNALAVDQIEVAYSTLLARAPATDGAVASSTQKFAKDGERHPRIIR